MKPFIDLKTQLAGIRGAMETAINRVLDHGLFILGPEVYLLEQQLSVFCGAKHTITCSNGTDALGLVLLAKGVGPGDAVCVPSFTYAATAEAVALQGAVPVFIDVLEDTYTMAPQSLERGIAKAKALGLRPVGIIPVDLFGQPAAYDLLQPIADFHSLWVMADAAQSFGASYQGQKVGTFADVSITSFFPAKPLGCFGDGGAIFTSDDGLASLLMSLRMHGQGEDKYDNVRIGMNARLDTLQAAVLLEKLKIFPDELKARQKTADAYNAALNGIVKTPSLRAGATSSWAQYTIFLPEGMTRSCVMAALKEVGIPSVIYYATPLHLQKAYQAYPRAEDSLPICEALADRVLSLPMSGYVDPNIPLQVCNILSKQ